MTRDTIVRLFQEARQNPSAPYDDDRLLAFLTDPPAAKGRRVRDTFAGRRRYVRFMEATQLELGICFTFEEWESGYTLDKLVALAESKAANPKQALKLTRQRLSDAQRRRINDPVKFGLLAAPLLVVAMFAPFWVLRIGLAIVWLAITVGVAALVRGEVRYSERLIARIENP
jgi:hypothetical protein